jgi:hypothetical protein
MENAGTEDPPTFSRSIDVTKSFLEIKKEIFEGISRCCPLMELKDESQITLHLVERDRNRSITSYLKEECRKSPTYNYQVRIPARYLSASLADWKLDPKGANHIIVDVQERFQKNGSIAVRDNCDTCNASPVRQICDCREVFAHLC